MKCGICNKEIIFETDEDREYGMVLNAKTLDKFVYGKYYKDQFGIDALEDIHKAVVPKTEKSF